MIPPRLFHYFVKIETKYRLHNKRGKKSVVITGGHKLENVSIALFGGVFWGFLKKI